MPPRQTALQTADGNPLLDWLNYEEGTPTPHEMKRNAELDDCESSINSESDGADETIHEWNPGDVIPFIDDPEAGVACRDGLRQFADAWIESHYSTKNWSIRSAMEKALQQRKAVLIDWSPPSLYFELPRSKDQTQDSYWVAVWYFFSSLPLRNSTDWAVV